MWGRINDLRVIELGNPGAQRDKLNALVLSGAKTATAGLLTLDYQSEREEVEHLGEHLALVDSSGAYLATLEVTEITQHPFLEVPWPFAQAEGENFQSIEEWREAHHRYWSTQGTQIDDTSTVVCLHFHVLSP